MKDDLGTDFAPGPAPSRVVSMVPSITETVAQLDAELLVGATDYCTHPSWLDVPRIGGSKYPVVERIVDCRPDLVLANAEENRKSDVEQLRAADIPVWVCFPRNVVEACDSAANMAIHALQRPVPEWIPQARRVWQTPVETTYRAAVPIWRKPWMALGAGTFAGDVLARLGITNVYDDAEAPYPKFQPHEAVARNLDLVVLPDEPYPFTATDGPEAFPEVPYRLVSGRHLTWHGPSLAQARDLLREQLSVE